MRGLIDDLQRRGGIARFPTHPRPGVFGFPQSRLVYDWKDFDVFDFMILGDDYSDEVRTSARVAALAFKRRNPGMNLCTVTEAEGLVIYREQTGSFNVRR